jgi:hypothetical protein
MARKFLNGIDLASQKIVNLADPSSSTDAVTKQYADNLARGAKWKDPVRAATTANGTLSTAFANGQTIDGVTLATGDRILLKNQTTGADNGIYVVAATGAPTRAVDADGAGEIVAGVTVYVTEGTSNGDKSFAITTDGAITIGTTATTWGQIGGGTTYSAGNGLSLSSTTFAVVADTGILVSGSGVAVDTSVVTKKFSANVGNGSSTAITVTHNLGTRDVVVAVYDATGFDEVECDVNHATTNTVVLTFATAPSSNQYRAVVHG